MAAGPVRLPNMQVLPCCMPGTGLGDGDTAVSNKLYCPSRQADRNGTTLNMVGGSGWGGLSGRLGVKKGFGAVVGGLEGVSRAQDHTHLIRAALRSPMPARPGHGPARVGLSRTAHPGSLDPSRALSPV